MELGDDLPKISGYTLVREIGRGGGGVVYEGISAATGRSVALKFMHPRHDRPTDRVLHEVNRLSEIRSRAVPHIYEHGWADGRMYLVMELIDGAPLLEYAKGLGVRARVELLARVADGVRELHEQGVIHRDLKPSNILVTDQGIPVIVDLGIAMLLGEDTDEHTDDDELPVGTLAYMAPEQARGVSAAVSTRSDVYALGAIGYELLTGSTPNALSSTVTQSIRLRQKEPPRPARTLNPSLPIAIARILEHACAFDPAERYDSAGSLRDDLKRWLDREPISVGPQTVCMRIARFHLKHPILAFALICLGVAVAILSSTSAYVWWQHSQPYEFLFSSSEESSRVSLVSRSGRVLHSWETLSKNGIPFGGRLLEWDNKRYAVLGFKTPDVTTGLSGLFAYELGAYDAPAWIGEPRIPDELMYGVRNEPRPHRFLLYKVYLFDIFPESEGLELVSISRHAKWSPTVVQIHRADGELLSEFAHDGQLDAIYWEPRNGILYCLGQNSDGHWVHRGADKPNNLRYPIVIFAIHPKLGELDASIAHPGRHGTKDPLWYRCLLPSEHYDNLGMDIASVKPTLAVPSRMDEELDGCIGIQLAEFQGGEYVNLVVTPEGKLLRTWATDNWSAKSGLQPSDFWLGDLPPRISGDEDSP